MKSRRVNRWACFAGGSAVPVDRCREPVCEWGWCGSAVWQCWNRGSFESNQPKLCGKNVPIAQSPFAPSGWVTGSARPCAPERGTIRPLPRDVEQYPAHPPHPNHPCSGLGGGIYAKYQTFGKKTPGKKLISKKYKSSHGCLHPRAVASSRTGTQLHTFRGEPGQLSQED